MSLRTVGYCFPSGERFDQADSLMGRALISEGTPTRLIARLMLWASVIRLNSALTFSRPRTPAFCMLYEGMIAGWISFVRVADQPHAIELESWVGAAYQGRWIAAICGRRLIAYGFDVLESQEGRGLRGCW